MKKSILSVCALFALTAVSAQSYPKQPDPKTVNVVPYEKPVQSEQIPTSTEQAMGTTTEAKGKNTTATAAAAATARKEGNGTAGPAEEALVDND